MAAKQAKKKIYFMKEKDHAGILGDKVYRISRVVGGTSPDPGDYMTKAEVDELIESGIECIIDPGR